MILDIYPYKMTDERYIHVWNNCLNFIQQNIDPKQFNLWFRPVKPVSLVESTLTVEVPSEFFREYLEGAYLDILKAALKKELGVGAKLVYVVTPVQKQPSLVYPASHGNVPVNKTMSVETFSRGGNPGPFVFPGIQRVQVNPNGPGLPPLENVSTDMVLFTGTFPCDAG